jgi:predicted flap endonuclease-1-like 5' DNA nuclease
MGVEAIEGVGMVYQSKLRDAGIRTVESLLKLGASRKGRRQLAEKTGISEKLILEWVNRADLMRIKGVGEEYSDLLEAAGVDTVRELAVRNPDNLHQAMLEVNQRKHLVRRAPVLVQVQNWISQAKSLPAIITY